MAPLGLGELLLVSHSQFAGQDPEWESSFQTAHDMTLLYYEMELGQLED